MTLCSKLISIMEFDQTSIQFRHKSFTGYQDYIVPEDFVDFSQLGQFPVIIVTQVMRLNFAYKFCNGYKISGCANCR